MLFEYINQFGVLYSENQFCTVNISIVVTSYLIYLFVSFKPNDLFWYLLPQNYINESFFKLQQNQ